MTWTTRGCQEEEEQHRGVGTAMVTLQRCRASMSLATPHDMTWVIH